MSAIDYEAVNKCWRRNKAALTRAKNQGDQRKIIEVCDRAFEDFERYGYPDYWHTFNIARDDARFALDRETW